MAKPGEFQDSLKLKQRKLNYSQWALHMLEKHKTAKRAVTGLLGAARNP